MAAYCDITDQLLSPTLIQKVYLLTKMIEELSGKQSGECASRQGGKTRQKEQQA